MVTARLRHTFKYPTGPDDEDDDQPEHLDEEEQDSLIQDLRAQNESRNNLYTTLLLALSVLLTIPYLAILPSDPLLATLAGTSLLSTAYTLVYIPFTNPAAVPLRPVERWLSILNAALCVLIFMATVVRSGEWDWSDNMLWLGMAPGVVYGVVMVARREMRAVDVGQLETLRYGYKGA